MRDLAIASSACALAFASFVSGMWVLPLRTQHLSAQRPVIGMSSLSGIRTRDLQERKAGVLGKKEQHPNGADGTHCSIAVIPILSNSHSPSHINYIATLCNFQLHDPC